MHTFSALLKFFSASAACSAQNLVIQLNNETLTAEDEVADVDAAPEDQATRHVCILVAVHHSACQP